MNTKEKYSVIECIVETQGSPNYKDAHVFYIQNSEQQIVAGPYRNRNLAEAELILSFS